MRTGYLKELTEAKARRVAQIKMLEACVCAWPVVRFRNGSGHAEQCPAHLMFLDKKAGR
jgi:hypothetical protein